MDRAAPSLLAGGLALTMCCSLALLMPATGNAEPGPCTKCSYDEPCPTADVGTDGGCKYEWICMDPWDPECGGGEGWIFQCWMEGELCEEEPLALSMSGQVLPGSGDVGGWVRETRIRVDPLTGEIRRTCDGVILAALPDDLSARGDGTEEPTDPPTRP